MLDDCGFRLLKLIERQAGLSQREMAQQLGISVGKLNYELRALIDGGMVRVIVPDQHGRRLVNSYELTERGQAAKHEASAKVLELRKREYVQLGHEIEQLSREVSVSDVKKQ